MKKSALTFSHVIRVLTASIRVVRVGDLILSLVILVLLVNSSTIPLAGKFVPRIQPFLKQILIQERLYVCHVHSLARLVISSGVARLVSMGTHS